MVAFFLASSVFAVTPQDGNFRILPEKTYGLKGPDFDVKIVTSSGISFKTNFTEGDDLYNLGYVELIQSYPKFGMENVCKKILYNLHRIYDELLSDIVITTFPDIQEMFKDGLLKNAMMVNPWYSRPYDYNVEFVSFVLDEKDQKKLTKLLEDDVKDYKCESETDVYKGGKWQFNYLIFEKMDNSMSLAIYASHLDKPELRYMVHDLYGKAEMCGTLDDLPPCSKSGSSYVVIILVAVLVVAVVVFASYMLRCKKKKSPPKPPASASLGVSKRHGVSRRQ